MCEDELVTITMVIIAFTSNNTINIVHVLYEQQLQ